MMMMSAEAKINKCTDHARRIIAKEEDHKKIKKTEEKIINFSFWNKIGVR